MGRVRHGTDRGVLVGVGLVAAVFLMAGCEQMPRDERDAMESEHLGSPEFLSAHDQAAQDQAPHGQVAIVLSMWHRAAAKGDFSGYFGRMTPDAVFCGTDASERWTRSAFESFAKPYFDGVHAWTYEQRETHLIAGPGDDPGVVWFDELLWNEKYGECRGTGVAERGDDGAWRIAHYSLSLLVPNGVAGEVVDLIRDSE